MKFGKINIKVDYKKAGAQVEPEALPHMEAYLLNPAGEDEKRKAVIICPGGDYHEIEKDGAESLVMKYLNAGMDAFVLWYSVEPAVFPMALMELAQAVRIVREHAEEWGIDPNGIAVCGKKAGGHLAASLSCLWNSGFLADSLDTSADRIRPNAAILNTPVITSGAHAHANSFACLLRGMSQEYLELTSLEKQVTADNPDTFIWHAFDDAEVPVENALLYMTALKEHQIPFEAHIPAASRQEVTDFGDLAANWMKNL